MPSYDFRDITQECIRNYLPNMTTRRYDHNSKINQQSDCVNIKRERKRSDLVLWQAPIPTGIQKRQKQPPHTQTPSKPSITWVIQ